MSNPVRTRFAPSPTGFLHIGGVRTALFAWLLARGNDGQFVLRFEDTDKSREVAGAKDHIIKCLSQLELDWDEGPDKGGPYAPYEQSQRLDIYASWAKKLIKSGRAYADTHTPEQLNELRREAVSNKQPFLFREHRPDNSPAWEIGMPLRFLSNPKPYEWHDIVMGDLISGPEVVDDIVIMKSDGFPTYNFAHIVDDCEMRISHILRGQEFLASVPNYLNLYEALGITPPNFATMPHVLSAAGNKKLSKRDGAKDVLDYIKDGYLPDALISFIATLGWNDGTKQEIYTREQLIDKFSLDRVQRSGARFDERRLSWINGSLIRSLTIDELFKRTKPYWPREAADASDDYLKSILAIIQERLKYLAELPGLTRFFFVEPEINSALIKDNKRLNKLPAEDLKRWLNTAIERLGSSDFSATDLTDKLNSLLEETGQKPPVLFSLLRIAVTQSMSSPGLADTMAVLGKQRSLDRLRAQLQPL